MLAPKAPLSTVPLGSHQGHTALATWLRLPPIAGSPMVDLLRRPPAARSTIPAKRRRRE